VHHHKDDENSDSGMDLKRKDEVRVGLRVIILTSLFGSLKKSRRRQAMTALLRQS
jgi:hypothetical protein